MDAWLTVFTFQGGTLMLVLSCKVGQRIVIPTIGAEIVIVAIKGKSARVGVTALAEVAVNRVEVCRRPNGQPVETDMRWMTESSLEIGQEQVCWPATA